MSSNAVGIMAEVIEKSSIELRHNGRFKGVFAKKVIRENSVVIHLRGDVSTQPTKYTIQLDSERHLNLPADKKTDDDVDYCWQYLNHSCEPNGYINAAELTVRALRDIAPGEEITFNYLTTEFEMAAPFKCSCGSPNCFGFIQGRNFLTQAEADRLLSL
jgi:SET domain-containing protein